MNPSEAYTLAVHLLQELIAVPSFSTSEEATAATIKKQLQKYSQKVFEAGNNVYAFNKYFDPAKPTLLLNSHHDTVRPSSLYTRNPYAADIEGDTLFGLGSNDAGASLVSLMAAFLVCSDRSDLAYNLCFAATAEEEISGRGGMELFLSHVRHFHPLGNHPGDCAIIGEPTQMQPTVAEMGLVVLDAETLGVSGHAARQEGVNALYLAMEDIATLRSLSFEKESPLLGPVHLAVTHIETPNKAHNVIPDRCTFTVDVRVNEQYTLEEVVGIIQKNIQATVRPRSLRIRSTMIETEHPLVVAALTEGKRVMGSATTSDKALVGMPALKMGPGHSSRSHAPDEYILLNEIREAIVDYVGLVERLSSL